MLQEQELELSHVLAHDLRDLEARYVLLETNFNRQVAAARQVEAVEAAYKADTITLDVLLNAQRLLAQDQSEYFRSLVDYNKSIALVHMRKNSLLEYNNVFLAEGPWPAKAYFDAARRARSRDAAVYMDYGITSPRVVSRGPVEQNAGQGVQAVEEAAVQNAPEVVPTPTPAGAAPKPPVPTPVPVVPAPAKSAATAAPSAPRAGDAAWQTASHSGPVATASSKGSTAKASKGYDLGEMNLSELAAKPKGPSRPTAPAVRPASYQASPADANQATAAAGDPGWTSAPGSSASHESDSNLSSAQSRSSASGWTRAQR
jgi:hypothetical protein